MLDLALIPVLGLLGLIALSVVVLNRRGGQVAAARSSVDDMVGNIRKKDRKNDLAFVENVIAGKPVDECLAEHRQTRSSLFPDASCGDRHWAEEDLTAWRKAAIVNEVEAINRKLMVPAISIALVLIGCCIVVLTVVYNFRSSGDAVSPLASPAPAPQVDWSSPGFPPPATSFPAPAPSMMRHDDLPPVPAGGTSSSHNDIPPNVHAPENPSATGEPAGDVPFPNPAVLPAPVEEN